jgi:hypothetical protein
MSDKVENEFDLMIRKYPLEEATIDIISKMFSVIADNIRTTSLTVAKIKLPEKSVADFCQVLFYKTIEIDYTISKRSTHAISIDFIDKYFGREAASLKRSMEAFILNSLSRGVPESQIVFYLINLYYEAVHKKHFKGQVFEMYDE